MVNMHFARNMTLVDSYSDVYNQVCVVMLFCVVVLRYIFNMGLSGPCFSPISLFYGHQFELEHGD